MLECGFTTSCTPRTTHSNKVYPYHIDIFYPVAILCSLDLVFYLWMQLPMLNFYCYVKFMDATLPKNKKIIRRLHQTDFLIYYWVDAASVAQHAVLLVHDNCPLGRQYLRLATTRLPKLCGQLRTHSGMSGATCGCFPKRHRLNTNLAIVMADQRCIDRIDGTLTASFLRHKSCKMAFCH